MSLKIRQFPDTWYFSNGILTENTQALYKLRENELTIIEIRYLPQIIKYLQQKLEVSKISLRWYPDKSTATRMLTRKEVSESSSKGYTTVPE